MKTTQFTIHNSRLINANSGWISPIHEEQIDPDSDN